MNMLADLVQVVIGVDTHKHPHSAAVPGRGHRRGWTRRPSPTDPAGYVAGRGWQPTGGTQRAWAMEGTGGYGAGLARQLASLGE